MSVIDSNHCLSIFRLRTTYCTIFSFIYLIRCEIRFRDYSPTALRYYTLGHRIQIIPKSLQLFNYYQLKHVVDSLIFLLTIKRDVHMYIKFCHPFYKAIWTIFFRKFSDPINQICTKNLSHLMLSTFFQLHNAVKGDSRDSMLW